jgi:elongation factor 1-alpha
LFTKNIVLDKMVNQHIRVAVVGDVDSSKSTLIGTLVTGTLDDGRGLARSKITKHQHERDSGRTSSISTHLVGLSEDTYETVTGGYQKIVLQADRIVTLMDLAGHEKYLKTTVGGVARGMSVR